MTDTTQPTIEEQLALLTSRVTKLETARVESTDLSALTNRVTAVENKASKTDSNHANLLRRLAKKISYL